MRFQILRSFYVRLSYLRSLARFVLNLFFPSLSPEKKSTMKISRKNGLQENAESIENCARRKQQNLKLNKNFFPVKRRRVVRRKEARSRTVQFMSAFFRRHSSIFIRERKGRSTTRTRASLRLDIYSAELSQ